MPDITESETRRRNLERMIAGGDGPIPRGRVAAFARLHGLDATYLSQLLNRHRSFGEKAARTMEERAGLARHALDAAELPEQHILLGESVGETAHNGRGTVAVLEWVRADSVYPSSRLDALRRSATTRLPCPVSHSPSTFVLRVTGPSMSSASGGPSFAAGDYIYIDPAAPARDGSFVLARVPGESELIFRQLVEADGRRYLQALNPAWPNRIQLLPDDGEIVGTVIFSGRAWA